MNEPDVFLYVITEQALHDSTATILHTDRYEYSPAINVSQYSFSNSPPDPGLHHEIEQLPASMNPRPGHERLRKPPPYGHGRACLALLDEGCLKPGRMGRPRNGLSDHASTPQAAVGRLFSVP